MKSLVRAIELLRCFRDESECLRLTDLVDRAHLHKTTAHRMLSALVKGGLLLRVDSNKYRLAIRPLGKARFRIGYGVQSFEFSFNRAICGSLQRAAALADIDLMVLDNDDQANRAMQNADVFVREHMDLVIESQTDARIAGDISRKFLVAQIPVIALEIPQPRAIFFGANNVQAGFIAGRSLARWAETHWNGMAEELILLTLSKAGQIPNSRMLASMLGVTERLAWISQDQIKRLDTSGHFENALALVRRHLQSCRSKRILVAAINDASALGALQAFRDLGREEQCAIVSHNASSEIHSELRRKDTRLIGSVGYFPERYGAGIVPLALDILCGRKVSRVNFVRHEMITGRNIDSFYPA